MQMACCTNPPSDAVYDELAPDMKTSSSNDSTATDESEVLNTDYRKVTPLFRNIERENWEGVLMFLNTGKWSSSLLSSSNDHLRDPGPEIQVKTWVTAYNRKGEPEWSQLPIHAAISYLAPFVVVQKMIRLYPKSLHCTDNEGMLPAHLAWGFGAPDNVISLLLEPFPSAVNEKGLGGRYPYECCELGPNKSRGKVFKIVGEQIEARTRRDMEQELREYAIQASKTVGLKTPMSLHKKQLSQFMLELLQDRKELEELRAKAKAAASVKSAPTTTQPKPSSTSVQAAPKSSSHSVTDKSSTASPGAARGGRKGLRGRGSKMAAKPPSTPRTPARGRQQANNNRNSSSVPAPTRKYSI